MAIRPVFVADIGTKGFVKEVPVSFTWYAGFSVAQKQRSIVSLQENFQHFYKDSKVLEISSKSTERVGNSLSAFNMMIYNGEFGKNYTVECAFQGSKVFERGGPYKDLLDDSSLEAKRDTRLKTSGRLITFDYGGYKWPLDPKTAFYDWLYMSSLYKKNALKEEVLSYDAFTDIEFNPDKSINCQARSAALFVSLHESGRLDEAMHDVKGYVNVLVSINNDKI